MKTCNKCGAEMLKGEICDCPPPLITLREELRQTLDLIYESSNWSINASDLDRILTETAAADAERVRLAEIGQLVEELSRGRNLSIWGSADHGEDGCTSVELYDHLVAPVERLGGNETWGMDSLLEALRELAGKVGVE